MAMFAISKETMDGLADAIRSVNGSTKKYTPQEMIAEVRDILNAATFILVDEDGNEYPATYVASDTIFTATENDIRAGKVAANADGVVTGTKEIPPYYAWQGYRLVPANRPIAIAIPEYDYTKLQTIICTFNTSVSNSVAAEKVSIENRVYDVRSSDAISEVTKDDTTKSVDFGILNTGDKPCLIRYFLYKEIY